MSQWDHGFDVRTLVREVLKRCEVIAGFSEEPGRITRTFLCPAMQSVHDCLAEWMRVAGMAVRRDALGNLIGRYPAAASDAPLLLIGSHLDSVPNAGKYDGVLGVLLGLAAVQALAGWRLPFAVDLLGFSEEEGIRYRTPYLGSLAVCGRFDAALLDRTDAAGIPMADALRAFGLDPARIPEAAYRGEHLLGYLEAHIEQGPVLEAAQLPIGVVEAIAGQSRLWVRFHGQAGHAGTLPMEHRRDALAAAAELVLHLETLARSTPGLRGTVGTLTVTPGAVNVVPGSARLSLDIRHAQDAVREGAVAQVLREAETIAARRRVTFQVDQAEHHAAVPADPHLTGLLATAVDAVGVPVQRLVSGAGHDAAVMAAIAPMALLFLRSPGGISHHPDEAVLPADVETALRILVEFLSRFSMTQSGVSGSNQGCQAHERG